MLPRLSHSTARLDRPRASLGNRRPIAMSGNSRDTSGSMSFHDHARIPSSLLFESASQQRGRDRCRATGGGAADARNIFIRPGVFRTRPLFTSTVVGVPRVTSWHRAGRAGWRRVTAWFRARLTVETPPLLEDFQARHAPEFHSTGEPVAGPSAGVAPDEAGIKIGLRIDGFRIGGVSAFAPTAAILSSANQHFPDDDASPQCCAWAGLCQRVRMRAL